jgi:hypothetical protein
MLLLPHLRIVLYYFLVEDILHLPLETVVKGILGLLHRTLCISYAYLLVFDELLLQTLVLLLQLVHPCLVFCIDLLGNLKLEAFYDVEDGLVTLLFCVDSAQV